MITSSILLLFVHSLYYHFSKLDQVSVSLIADIYQLITGRPEFIAFLFTERCIKTGPLVAEWVASGLKQGRWSLT